MIDKCKHGHTLTEKTIRWIMVKGYLRRKCRICEANAFRLKYKTNAAFREAKRAYGLNYFRTKVAP